MGDSLAILKGTLDLLVLKALTNGERHGFEITQWIEERSGGTLDFDDSGVYHALYRLEKRGLVKADWGVTAKNRQARYYSLTRKGSAHLTEETDRLLQYAATLGAILTSPADG